MGQQQLFCGVRHAALDSYSTTNKQQPPHTLAGPDVNRARCGYQQGLQIWLIPLSPVLGHHWDILDGPLGVKAHTQEPNAQLLTNCLDLHAVCKHTRFEYTGQC